MYEQQGLFYQSQKLYEEIIARTVDLYINEPNLTNQDELLEFNLWEERWIRCCKELNQWTELNEYSQSKESDISLSLECAWKQPTNDWQSMKSLLQTPQKDINLPKEKSWRWSLYQGYYLVCNPEDYNHLMMITANSAASTSGQQLVISPSTAVESKMERCMHMALKEWRRLPRLVSPVHITLLQAAQQIVELQEAFQIQNNLLTLAQLNQPGSSNSNINPNSILQEIKAIIKTWRARLPLISDDLSYWNDIFTWRQYHYESFTRFYDKQQAISGTGANPAMLGVHALAQGIVHFGKIARKQHLYDLCLETLNKIHKKQSVPVIDCFLKVKQEIKCYINTFDYLSKQQSQELLDVIEATNLKYFTKENVAELISLKAHFLQLCGKYDDANHLYSFSIYLNDAQPRLWGSWGDYLTQAYVNVSSASPTSFQKRSIETAESALIALMHAARHPNSECKARKFIAKILWLLTYDNDRRQLFTIFDMYSTQIPAANWINWIPQLITLLVKNDDTGKYLINLMHQICRMYPLALYYPLRSLYLKLKSEENTEKIKFQYQQQIQQQQHQQQQGNDVEMKESPSTPKPMPQPSTTTESLIRVTKLMHSQREMHPTLFNTLENLIDQLLWLKVNWYEESLRNFKQTLYACYTLVFDYISLCLKNPRQQQQQPIHEYCIDPFSIIWFKRLFKFYADTSYLEKYQLNRNLFNNANNSPSTPTTAGGSAANQQANSSQNHRFRSILAVFNDPNYLITRQKFQQDFNYQLSNTPSVNVFSMISKLKSWVKLFELHLKTGPKQQLLEERLKNVTQFCSSTADIEIPGEFLIPRHTNYYVKISKFLPKLEWVEKYNAYSRRISIRGHNGKIYPFLISNESNYYECRKEEHIMQLMRMINTYMSKQKETSRRNLHFTLPRIVSLSNEVRMVEDDCSATGLLDVYKNRMRKLSMHKAFTQTSNKAQTKSSSTPEVSPPTNLKILLMSEAGDLPLARYFERIQMASASISSAASSSSSTSNTNSTQMPAINKQFFVDLYKVIAGTLLPKTLLKEWAVHAYSDSTDYFHFRKLFTSQLAIFSLIEHVCCLTRINPDQFYLSQNTGTCQSIRLKFDLNESFNSNQTNVSSMLSYYQQITDFNPERPVPFRLSPNVSEFITSAGISGLLSAIKIALARCLVQPQYQFSWILRAILKDEILTCVSRKVKFKFKFDQF
jgi:transformation/transcription domain-associated protein